MSISLKVANDQSGRVPASLTKGGSDGTFNAMEARVSKLETDMTEIKVTLGRLDERLTAMSSALASKADVAEIKGELRGKLGFWQFLGVVLAIGALIVKWPELFRSVGIS